MNRLTCTGRLVADPTYKELPGETGHVTEMRLAVDGMGRGGRDQAGYIDVHSYDMTQHAAETLGKGWLVAIDGRLQHETYEKDGQKRTAYRLIGHVDFLARPRGDYGTAETVGVTGADDDIPF